MLQTHVKDPRLLNLVTELTGSLFFSRFPKWVLTSNNIKCDNPSSWYTGLDSACQNPWISIDSKDFQNAIILDIDHPDGVSLALELPECIRPHVVVDPWSGRSAAIFMLSAPVWRDGRYPRQKQFVKAMSQRLLSHFLTGMDNGRPNATILPVGSLTKNPFGLASRVAGNLRRRQRVPDLYEAWEASGSTRLFHTVWGSECVDLNSVAFYLERIEYQYRPSWDGEPSSKGRNCELFDRLRHWCYDHCEKDFAKITTRALELNSFPVPLSIPETMGIARSVWKYMYFRYRSKRCPNEGIMGLKGTGIPLKQKQSMSGRRSRAILQEKNLKMVIAARKPGMTQREVCAATGLSRSTIQRCWAASEGSSSIPGSVSSAAAKPISIPANPILPSWLLPEGGEGRIGSTNKGIGLTNKGIGLTNREFRALKEIGSTIKDLGPQGELKGSTGNLGDLKEIGSTGNLFVYNGD